MKQRLSRLFESSMNGVQVWNALVTSIYKALGLVMLTVILLGLVSYFGIHAFYLLCNSWVAPVVLSSLHERVVQVSSHELQQSHQRDRMRAERLSLLGQLESAERAMAMNEAFQQRFRGALAQELSSREEFLSDAAGLERQQATSLHELTEANGLFLDSAQQELEQQWQAGLIDRMSYVEARRGLASIGQTELTLQETGIRLGTELRDSRREVDDMRVVLASVVGAAATAPTPGQSYGVLQMEREFQKTMLETDQLRRERDDAKRLIALLDNSIAQYDMLLTELHTSPYRRALSERVTLAFVPYENLENARKGKALYVCAAGPLWCHRAGTVIATVDGEVNVKHPLSGEPIRGVMIEIDVSEPHWAEEKVLYLGRAPLIL